ALFEPSIRHKPGGLQRRFGPLSPSTFENRCYSPDLWEPLPAQKWQQALKHLLPVGKLAATVFRRVGLRRRVRAIGLARARADRWFARLRGETRRRFAQARGSMAPDLRSRGGERIRPERRQQHGSEDPSGQESEALSVNHDHEMSTPPTLVPSVEKNLRPSRWRRRTEWMYF